MTAGGFPSSYAMHDPDVVERELGLRGAPEEVEALVLPCGFAKVAEVDLGHNYLVRFVAV